MTTNKKERKPKITRRPPDEVLLAAIKGSGAVMSTVAKRLKIDWTTAKNYIDASPVTKQAFLDEEETVLDMCESTLHNAVKAKDTAAAKWLLATKGKKRGYSEKHEVEHTGSLPVTINIIGVEPDKS